MRRNREIQVSQHTLEERISEGAERSPVTQTRLRKVYFAIQSLSERQKVCLLMKFCEGKKYREISEELGIGITTIQIHIKRGIELIKKDIEDKRRKK